MALGKKAFENRIEALPKVSIRGRLGLTPQVKNIMKNAEEIAMDAQSSSIGTEHILYAIVSDEKCLAYNLLGYLLNEGRNEIDKIADELEDILGFTDENEGPDEFVRSDEAAIGDNSSSFSLL